MPTIIVGGAAQDPCMADEKFLYAKSDGRYARVTDGHHPHPAKADLRTDERAKRAS
jgi:hypothetical protein